ncbi:alpha/beta hydrolase [Stieleria sp. TO1_6]|uniref:alpha/beta hydrolase n=1 Tax=Stieleria tagensis TaxID=2956795 RepID=UPI00209AD148|nr:alpha/beta hydrolase [Stieleria tagensis]MCO8123767.1 alpha/beta hydrolase [Stieleria tagensis]
MTTDNPRPASQDTQQTDQRPPGPAKRRRHWAISILRIVVIAYATMLLMLMVMESRLVYPGAYAEPRDVLRQSQVQAFEYPAADGSTITGRRVDRAGSNRTVLFLHGNGIRASWMDDWTLQLSQQLDANVVTAEYRGFDDDDVTPTEANLIADSLAAHDAVCKLYSLSPEELIVYGRSLGGGCAAAVAAEKKSDTLILDRTFDSVVDVASDRFPMFPIRWVMRNRFDSVSRLQSFQGKLIQIHGTPDRIVPIKNGKRLFESIPSSDKQFIEVPGLWHNDPMSNVTLKKIAQRLPVRAGVEASAD